MYVFRIFRTFMIVTFAGFFDVIAPVRTGLQCFINTFLHFRPGEGFEMIAQLFADGVTSVYAMVAAAIALTFVIVNSVIKERGSDPRAKICGYHFAIRWVICFVLMIFLMYSFTVSSGIRGFMYAAF